MANKPKEQKTTDAQYEAAKEIYNVAKKEGDVEIARLNSEIEAVREESRFEGILDKIDYDIAHNEFLKVLTLYRVKQSKDYKKGGKTWDEFCDAHGYVRKTADRLIEELKPLFGQFSDKLSGLSGIGFNKIRLLGRSVSDNLSGIDDGCLIYGDQKIPLTPEYKDEIEAVIDQIKDEAENAKKEQALDAKAKNRVLKEKEKTINKLHKALEVLEGQAKEKNLTPEEEGFMKKVDGLRFGFDGYLLQLDPERMEDLSFDTDPAPTPRMRAIYLASLDYMKKQILVAYERATEMYGNAIMCPEAAWKPGMGVALTAVGTEPADKSSTMET
ncbi:MAG: hypothetical protein NTV58_12160 [Deltaproteobacteria bacterium]|nr:hypothetical protein [Deltaproteobacteria bacterium]